MKMAWRGKASSNARFALAQKKKGEPGYTDCPEHLYHFSATDKKWKEEVGTTRRVVRRLH
jgi:hypothetical protein